LFFAEYRLFNRALLQKRPVISRRLPVLDFVIDPQGGADDKSSYGVATTSRLFKITGLFCKRAL